MSKKVKIGILLMILGVVVFTTIKITSAWLTDQKEKQMSLTLGDVEYLVNTDSIVLDDIVPGQTVLNGLTISNSSSVNTQFRVMIEYTVANSLDKDGTYYVNLTGIGNSINSEIFIVSKSSDSWVKGALDNYNYFGAETPLRTDGIASGAGVILPPVSETDLLDTLGLSINGGVVGNNYSNSTITVNIILQAKQADYVTWEDCATASIDFSLGISS